MFGFSHACLLFPVLFWGPAPPSPSPPSNTRTQIVSLPGKGTGSGLRMCLDVHVGLDEGWTPSSLVKKRAAHVTWERGRVIPRILGLSFLSSSFVGSWSATLRPKPALRAGSGKGIAPQK